MSLHEYPLDWRKQGENPVAITRGVRFCRPQNSNICSIDKTWIVCYNTRQLERLNVNVDFEIEYGEDLLMFFFYLELIFSTTIGA
jgi:hypothetical protein